MGNVICEVCHRPVILDGRFCGYYDEEDSEWIDTLMEQGDIRKPKRSDFAGKVYRLNSEGIPTFSGRYLNGPGGDDTPEGSFIVFDKNGEVIHIYDNLGNGIFERGPSIGDLSENEKTDLELVLSDADVSEVSPEEALREVKWLAITY